MCGGMYVRTCSVVIAASLKSRFGRTLGRIFIKSTQRVLGHSLLRAYSLAPHTLLLFHTACIARALHCAHLFAHPPTRTRAHGKKVFVHELNASISCSFNPLWATCLSECVCVCVCVCVFRFPSSLRLP